MATYNLKFNKDDSVVRHVVVGLLADLNSKLSFWRQISNDERCDPDGAFADGNYDKIPRGIVNLTSFAVDPSKLVNKRNMGQYSMMNEEGLMEGFVAEFEMIPVVIGVDVEILVSSQLDLFKITEAIVKKMYKANFYNVDAGHLEEGTYRISSEYMMPDDYTQEKPVEYSFDDKSNHKITFSLEISSFIPSFDFEEDTYRKFTRTTYANATCGDYENPNGFLDPTMTPNVYYDSYVPAKWVANGNEWVKTQEGIDCSDPTVRAGLGIEQNTESQIKRVRKRRKQSNRMFTIKNGPGPSNVQTENEKSMLGDNYTVKGRDYPFGGKITP